MCQGMKFNRDCSILGMEDGVRNSVPKAGNRAHPLLWGL